MRKNPAQVVFNVAPELLTGLQGIEAGHEYTLANNDLHDSVIQTVETTVTMTKRSSFNVVNMASVIVPETKGLFHEIIADEFADIVNKKPQMRLRAMQLKANSYFGALRVMDDRNDQINSGVTPVVVGNFWLVNSVLGHCHEEDRERGFSDLSRLLDTHSFLLSSLSRAIGLVRAERDDIEFDDNKKHSRKKKIITLSGPTHSSALIDVIPIEDTDEVLEQKSEPNIESDTEEEIIPNPFARFYGIDHAVEQLQEVIELANIPVEDREQHGVALTQGIILSGPSGVGKTELTAALAEGLEAELIEIKFSDLTSAYTGEWASKIAKIFVNASSKEHRVVVLFDEADGLIKAGNEGSNKNIESVLKKELEQLHKSPNVFVVFATNDESQMSPEVRAKKRIPLTIRLSPPTEKEREQIFDNLVGLGCVEFDEFMTSGGSQVWDMLQFNPDFYDFTELAKASDGLTAGDIVSAISEVRKKRFLKFRKEPEKLKSLISQDEILAGLKRFKATKEA